MSERRILHCFADTGVEGEALSAFGQVVRIGIDPTDKNDSEPIKADAHKLPIKPGTTFDVGLFHPPCAKWSPLTKISGDPDDHPNLIPLAREIAEEYCDEWIIENVPQAPLKDPVVLSGTNFGLPIIQRRAFETSFHVEQPKREHSLAEFRMNGPDNGSFEQLPTANGKEIWKAMKGYSGPYTRYEVEKAAVPRAYIDYLMRWFLLEEPDQEAAAQTEVVADD